MGVHAHPHAVSFPQLLIKAAVLLLVAVVVGKSAYQRGRQSVEAAGLQPASPAAGWERPAELPLGGINVATVAVSNPFLYGHMAADGDSYQVKDPNVRALEPALTAAWEAHVAPCCRAGGSVLDIGSHFGYYALLAASQGCSFLAVEPVPQFRSLVHLNLHLNSWLAAGEVVPHAVGNQSLTVKMEVPTTGVLGYARVMDSETKRYEKQSSQVIEVRQMRTDELLAAHPLAGRMCMMKVDVEGHEPGVLLSATELLSSPERRPPLIMIEFSPGFKTPGWEEMLALLHQHGYVAAEVNWKIAKAGLRPSAVDVSQALSKVWDISTPEARHKLITGIGFNTNLWLSLPGAAQPA